METKELLTTTTPEEKELISMVMARARQKAKGMRGVAPMSITQKEREGDIRVRLANGSDNLNLKLSSYSHNEEVI